MTNEHAGGSPARHWRTTSDILGEFSRLLDGPDAEVKAVCLDRGFYSSACLKLLYAHNYPHTMPVIKWDDTIQEELKGWCHEIKHDFAGKVRPLCSSIHHETREHYGKRWGLSRFSSQQSPWNPSERRHHALMSVLLPRRPNPRTGKE